MVCNTICVSMYVIFCQAQNKVQNVWLPNTAEPLKCSIPIKPTSQTVRSSKSMPCQTGNALAGCAKPGLLSALASPQPFDGTVPDMETRGRAGVLSTIDGSRGDTKNGSLEPQP